MKIVGIAITFIAGAACGAGGAWVGLKKHYEKKAQKEVSKARAAFHKMLKKEREKVATKTNAPAESDHLAKDSDNTPTLENSPKKSYEGLLIGLGYKDIPEPNTDTPYSINQAMFGNGGYPTITFTWYVEDNILCESASGEIIKEAEELIGSEGMDTLCASEVDHFFIRNEVFKLDICIDMEYEGRYHEDHTTPD